MEKQRQQRLEKKQAAKTSAKFTSNHRFKVEMTNKFVENEMEHMKKAGKLPTFVQQAPLKLESQKKIIGTDSCQKKF